jgi:hypothetical protein
MMRKAGALRAPLVARMRIGGGIGRGVRLVVEMVGMQGRGTGGSTEEVRSMVDEGIGKTDDRRPEGGRTEDATGMRRRTTMPSLLLWTCRTMAKAT